MAVGSIVGVGGGVVGVASAVAVAVGGMGVGVSVGGEDVAVGEGLGVTVGVEITAVGVARPLTSQPHTAISKEASNKATTKMRFMGS